MLFNFFHKKITLFCFTSRLKLIFMLKYYDFDQAKLIRTV